MELKRVNISFLLLDKKLGDDDVAGLAEFWVDPKNKGVGRATLQLIEALASPKLVVGFAEPNVVNFYTKCEWYVGKQVDGKYLVASEPINDAKFTGKTW